MNRRQFGAGVAALGAAALASGKGAAAPMLPEIASVLDARVAGGEAPGLVALLSRGDDVEVHASGVQSLEAGAPMRRDTIFRVASITKPVTAAAAMILVEEGALDLDDPVDPWLPELADRRVARSLTGPLDETVPARRPITLRDLLTMRMGLGAVFADPSASPLLTRMGELALAPSASLFPGTADEFMQRLSSLPLAFQPGERWLYHTGMDVAGVLISRASGMGLGAFLEQRIFDPLGMRDTGFWVPEEKRSRFATTYLRDGSGKLTVWDEQLGGDLSKAPAMELGGGGLVSTVDDFNIFGRMLLGRGTYRGKRILMPESVEQMVSDQIPPEVKAASPFFPGFWDTHGWGLGMAVVTAPDAISTCPGRFGWWGGTGTTFFADPHTGTVAVLMSQRMMTSADDTAMSNEFLRAAFGG